MFLVSGGSCDGRHRTVLLVLSLLVDAECIVGITASCGTEVKDVGVAELEEPVDKPGTTIGTYCSVLHCIFLPFSYEMWLLTTGPMEVILVIFAEFSK